jgi:tetratricopeptide (TPR) repeat protein
MLAEAQAQGRAGGSSNVDELVPTALWFVAGESADFAANRELFASAGLDESAGPWAAVTLALVDAQLGDSDAARARLDSCVAAIEAIPKDSEWLPCMTQAAEAVALVGAHPIAGRIYELLSPYADAFVVEGIGAVPRGSVERHLGLLAAALGDRDVARGHFERALAANRRLGAPLIVARTLYDAATALDDVDLRAQAIAACQTLGLQHRVELLGARSVEHAEAAFVRDGESWSLSWTGRTVTLRDSKGLRDLATLLAAPGRPVTALELASAVSVDRAATSDLARPGDLGEVIDASARRAYQQRLEQLATDAESADRSGDAARSIAIAAERDALLAQLRSAYGLGGRPRRVGDPAERARSTVTARIKDSMRRIDAVHPDLARHLRNAVRTGTVCSYEPETPVRWRLTS